MALKTMKFYLSSYKIGKETDKFLKMLNGKKRIAYIPNALDFAKDKERRDKSEQGDIQELESLGLIVERIDLKEYFGKKEELRKKLKKLGAVYVRGGNTFVLRQAMKLSGLDNILLSIKDQNFIYSGYSAGCCVLSPSLESSKLVDDSNIFPYKLKKPIFEGLGLIPYNFLPHFDSDHPESSDINKELAYCKKKGLPYKTVKDGEVIIIE
jgi:dipeptidase E